MALQMIKTIVGNYKTWIAPKLHVCVYRQMCSTIILIVGNYSAVSLGHLLGQQNSSTIKDNTQRIDHLESHSPGMLHEGFPWTIDWKKR